jgi:UDP-GlcNAc:undecaprenyl-phosphate GlcNAc-1-phosphate transferase
MVIVLLTAFLGSLCAFLWYNRPLASIYLGDAGSLFIGGFLATTPFLLNWGTYITYGYISPIVILGIPLLEVVSLIIIRCYKGIPFYRGSSDHFACYLQAKGWKKDHILLYVFGLSSMLGTIAFLFTYGIIPVHFLCCLGVFFLAGWVKILYKKEK